MATTSPTVADLLARNKASLSSFQPRPLFSEMPAMDISLPSTIIVACCDARAHPEEFFCLRPNEALVLRTAAGRVKPILKDLAALEAFIGYGKVKQLLIVHHTDCGGTHMKAADIRANIIARQPAKKPEIEAWDTPAFGGKSVAESVKDDVAIVK
ncbi:hypothetical protein V8D89_016325, partial [Ganoderma adspersum]